MYEKTDKRRLYWIINEYLVGNISNSTFCDEFYYCYSLSIDYEQLNEIEDQVFSELNNVVSRFSESKKDHALNPGFFTTPEQLRQKIIESKDILKKYLPFIFLNLGY